MSDAPSTALPPQARKIPRDVTVHGDPRVDDYFWLRNPENPAVINHLKAENAHTDAAMAPSIALQRDLEAEMKGRCRGDRKNLWGSRHGYTYYSLIREGEQHESYYRQAEQSSAEPELLLDVNALAQGHGYTSVDLFLVSPDGRRLAYAVDWTGEMVLDVYVMDLATRQLLPGTVRQVDDITWGGNDDLYYVTVNRVGRPDRFWRWNLTTGESKLLYHEANAAFILSTDASFDDHYVFCDITSKDTTEVLATRPDDPTGQMIAIQPRRTGHEYTVEHSEGMFYFRTNHQAPSGRLMCAPVATPGIEHWRDVLPEDPALLLSEMLVLHGHAVTLGTRAGVAEMRVTNLVTRETRPVAFDGQGFTVELGYRMDLGERAFDFTAESFCQPATTYTVDLLTLGMSAVRDAAPPGFQPERYQTEQLWATARDGVKVPISVVYRRDLDRSRPQPLCLTGYGSYGLSLLPNFDPERLSLLDRGMIYAIAHIRGGSELGAAWKQAGRMARKMTTFHDFIDCADWLVASGWTTSPQMVAEGSSAGGLLLGAVLNQRPNLFAGAVLSMPFVDVLNTMLDETIGQTIEEYREWGDPGIKEQYDWMRAYSPYDNLAPEAYPRVLVNVSMHDSLVPYWEGAKYVAKLRSCNTGAAITLLHVLIDAGHVGAAGRFDHIASTVRDQAFLLLSVGLGNVQSVAA